MASKFGGVAVNQAGTSRFGGIPVTQPVKQLPQEQRTLLSPRAQQELAPEQQQQLLQAREQQLGAVISPEQVQQTGPSLNVKTQQNLEAFRQSAPKGISFARDLPEIGEAPELGEFSLDAIKRSLAANLITDEVELGNALQQGIPGAQLVQDPEGNAVIKMPSGGEFAINKPGLSGQDFAQFATRALSFVPAGRLAGAARALVGATATETGLQTAEKALGGEFNKEDVLFEGVGTLAGLGLGKYIGRLSDKQIKQGVAKQTILKKIESGDADKALLGLREEGGRIFKDPIVKDAIKQGADERVLRSIETASPSTKSKMREMISILKKRRENADFAAIRRASDPMGASVFKRYKELNKLRRKAGVELNKVANESLKGQQVNISEAVDRFYISLDDMGIVSTGDPASPFKFSGMDDVNVSGARRILNRLDSRISADTGDIDALGAHKAKRLIDSAVDYGGLPTDKSKLPKQLEASLKELRADMNQAISDSVPEYAKANSKFADVVQPLSEMDSVFKNMLKLSRDESVETAIGTKAARTLMSNNVSRGAMIELLQQSDEVLARNGVRLDDDLIKQAVFIDELERLFGTEASTSFFGQSQRAREASLINAAFGDRLGATKELLESGIQKIKGVNDENAIKALEKILGDQ